MDRRDFLKSAGAITAAAFVQPGHVLAATGFTPSPANGWRMFEVTTRISLDPTDSETRVWVPLPSVYAETWMEPLGDNWQGNATSMALHQDPVSGAKMVAAVWPAGQPAPVLEVKSVFKTRDRAIDLSHPGKVPALDPATVKQYTSATNMLPTDGIVRSTALKITKGAKTDLEKAKAIYEWVVENTSRNASTKGCGTGDIRAMLETGVLTGKCADLNALYVGLARAVGIPARELFGIRVADSRYGYKSLGKSGDISKAQHCRAEVWLSGFGWVPVDPADVRKVVLEEKPGLTLNDDVVVAARKTLFGSWETNWMAYNYAHDLKLPGSKGPKVPFLMYPEGENGDGRFDCLDPTTFKYKITSREI